MFGQDGKINQTLLQMGCNAIPAYFHFGSLAGQNRKANVSLVVSAPDSSMEFF